MLTLQGRTCVFAGATAGDGVEAVKLLCAQGMNVVLMTHQPDRAASLMEEIRASGAPRRCICSVQGDRGAPEEDPEVYRAVEAELGSVDVVICNTGATGKAIPMEETTDAQLLRSIEHLAVGSFAMLRTALPYLRRSRAPRVIFMTSVEGAEGGVHESFANAVAKGTVRALTVNAAARLAPEGITVNCIAKGPIPRVEGIRPGDADPADLVPSVPMGRMGTAGELAALIAYLASEESGYLTGQTLSLSGGYGVRK